MKNLNTESIIRLITTFSVIIGMVLVIYELRQTRDLAETEIRTQALVLGMDLKSNLVSDRGIEALRKACLEEELTVEDIIVLDNYYRAIYDQINYMGLVSARFEYDWETYASNQLERIVFMTSHGRDWWNANESWMFPDLRIIGDRLLEDQAAQSCITAISLEYDLQPDSLAIQ